MYSETTFGPPYISVEAGAVRPTGFPCCPPARRHADGTHTRTRCRWWSCTARAPKGSAAANGVGLIARKPPREQANTRLHRDDRDPSAPTRPRPLAPPSRDARRNPRACASRRCRPAPCAECGRWRSCFHHHRSTARAGSRRAKDQRRQTGLLTRYPFGRSR